MRPVDCYFERILGFPPEGESRTERSAARLQAHPPFQLPCVAAELLWKGRAYRSLSPDLPKGAEALPMDRLGGKCMVLRVLLPREGWRLHRKPEALPLDGTLPVDGAARVPKGGIGYGIRWMGRVVSWACAAPAGEVWNVSVETSPRHRGKGFATDSLLALTDRLLSLGWAPIYLCEEDNAASVRTARAAGYEETGIWTRVMR